jgi:hypothetical protein
MRIIFRSSAGFLIDIEGQAVWMVSVEDLILSKLL